MSEINNILSSVGFNWHIALANFINFLIILFLLKIFFFEKIGNVIAERKQVIEQGIANAEEAEKKLASADKEKEHILRSAKHESHTIIVSAEHEARTLKEEAIHQAERDISAKQAALAEEEVMLATKVEKEFALHAPSLVASLFEKTLKKTMSPEENNALIARMK